MDNKNISLWSNLTFKTRCYRKNFDLITENEHIITEYDGTVSQLRLIEKKIPLVLGEFSFSVWNIQLAGELNINLYDLLKAYQTDNTYSELQYLIDDNIFDIKKYNKIVFLHSFILKNEYRKQGISEEFVEFLYRDFYDANTAIIALVMPFQDNKIDNDYYFNKKIIELGKQSGDKEIITTIPASEYYSLNELYDKDDKEYNEYKLFAAANRCGFNRIHDSHLFILNSDIVLERLKNKHMRDE